MIDLPFLYYELKKFFFNICLLLALHFGCFSDGCFLDGCSLDDCFSDGYFLDDCSLDGCSLNGYFLDGCFSDGCSLDGCFLDGCSLDGCPLDGRYGLTLFRYSLTDKDLFSSLLLSYSISFTLNSSIFWKSLDEGRKPMAWQGHCKMIYFTSKSN